MMKRKKGRIGAHFEEHLKARGTLGETAAVAVKRVLAWQLEQAMEKEQMSKNQMAKAMKTGTVPSTKLSSNSPTAEMAYDTNSSGPRATRSDSHPLSRSRGKAMAATPPSIAAPANPPCPFHTPTARAGSWPAAAPPLRTSVPGGGTSRWWMKTVA